MTDEEARKHLLTAAIIVKAKNNRTAARMLDRMSALNIGEEYERIKSGTSKRTAREREIIKYIAENINYDE